MNLETSTSIAVLAVAFALVRLLWVKADLARSGHERDTREIEELMALLNDLLQQESRDAASGRRVM